MTERISVLAESREVTDGLRKSAQGIRDRVARVKKVAPTADISMTPAELEQLAFCLERHATLVTGLSKIIDDVIRIAEQQHATIKALGSPHNTVSRKKHRWKWWRLERMFNVKQSP